MTEVLLRLFPPSAQDCAAIVMLLLLWQPLLLLLLLLVVVVVFAFWCKRLTALTLLNHDCCIMPGDAGSSILGCHSSAGNSSSSHTLLHWLLALGGC
jgi:hypothetical protein